MPAFQGSLQIQNNLREISDNNGQTMTLMNLGAPSITSLTDSTFSPSFSATNVQSLNGGQLAGYRNIIINGSCSIAQRGPVTWTAGTLGYSGPDRYYAVNEGTGTFTQSQGTITYGGLTYYSVTQTVNTAATTFATTDYWLGISQRIEGYNAYPLLGNSVTVSFIFNTNMTGTYSVALRDVPGTNSFVTTFVATANTPAYITIPIAPLPTYLGVLNTNVAGLQISIGGQSTGTFETSTLNQWASGNYFAATGSTIWGMTVGAYISVTNLQLEIGTVATPFENRGIGQEFQLCQRYYEVGDEPFFYIGTTDVYTTAAYDEVSFKVQKRVIPTMTTATWTYFDAGQNAAFTPTMSGVTPYRFGFMGTGLTNWNGWTGGGTWTASAEL